MQSRFRHPATTDKALSGEPATIGLDSPVEDLGLSVRTRNALRGIGCDTVEHVLALDLGSSVRGLGRKTKYELLSALERGGFRHPAMEEPPDTEIQVLERSLDRMQVRVEAALGAVTKEIRHLKLKLRSLPNGRDHE
jgi:hypothetical protein